MPEAEFDPKNHKDVIGVAAELVAQGIAIDDPYSRPIISRPWGCLFDPVKKVWRISQS